MHTAHDAVRWQRIKSLLAQALELPAEQRQAFVDAQAGGDADLQSDLRELLAIAQGSGGLLDMAASDLNVDALETRADPSWAGRRVGPWQLVSRLGSGGMGDVWLAQRADGAYDQQAAVKLMRDRLGRSTSEARFRLERQILAGLDHPNLARLLDGGITDDGVPYLVMELVRGEPLDAYCRRRELPLPARLQLFRTLCQVVHYAHGQGVIHRDLKPANILVTENSVVKLVDFGIAKQVSAPAPETATALRVMTPEFASPEQVSGASITPASDIFSLGVVLYRLLTDESPYPSAASGGYELIKAICDTEPVAPSRRLPRLMRRPLKGDLDAVVLKALRKRPEHRYASAELLADDVFRHLEGLPVKARDGAWSYRAGRFVLRHRTAVGATLVANLVLVAGLGFAAYEAYEANVQRARAQRHFDDVRQIANVFIFDIEKDLAKLPGSLDVRKRLVSTALTYLKQLAGEAAHEPGLAREIGTAYRQVGDVQGLPFGPNLGDPAGARESYDQARALLEPLVRGRPVDRVAQRELVKLYKSLGALDDSLGKAEDGERVLREGIAQAEDLVRAEPGERLQERLLAAMHGQLSQLKFYSGDLPGYEKEANFEYRWLADAIKRDPQDEKSLLDLSINLDLKGQFLAQRSDSDADGREALDAFQQALALQQRLLDRKPHDVNVMQTLATEHTNVGTTFERLNDFGAAAQSLREAIKLQRMLADRDPADLDARTSTAVALTNLSGVLRDQGDAAASAQAAREAIALHEGMPEAARAQVHARLSLARAHFNLGQALDAPLSPAALAASRPSCASYLRSETLLAAVQQQVGPVPNQLEPERVKAALQGCVNARGAAPGGDARRGAAVRDSTNGREWPRMAVTAIDASVVPLARLRERLWRHQPALTAAA